MLTDEITKDLLSTKESIDFSLVLFKYKLSVDEWQNDKEIFKHYKYLKANRKTFQELCASQCFLRPKKKID